MSVLPEQLGGWVAASIVKHFRDQRGSYDMFVEGQNRPNQIDEVLLELRFDGPVTQWKTKNEARIEVEINMLVQVVEQNTDTYKIHRVTAFVANMFTQCISLKRYGAVSDPLNDEKAIGTFKIETEGRDKLNVAHFGKLEPNTALLQATVEAKYRCYLNVEEIIT